MDWSNYLSQMYPMFACALAVHKFPSALNAGWSNLRVGWSNFPSWLDKSIFSSKNSQVILNKRGVIPHQVCMYVHIVCVGTFMSVCAGRFAFAPFAPSVMVFQLVCVGVFRVLYS